MKAVLLVLIFVAAGCSDRTRDIPPVNFEPPAPVDMSVPDESGIPVEPDSLCEGKLDGTSCVLPAALGVCAQQQCRLVACIAGSADCDDRPGCETSTTTDADCGVCGNLCGERETCAEGPSGYVCAAGIVCPRDQFDLDNDEDNGCEWRTEWGEAFIVSPVDLRVDAAGWSATEEWLLAGGVDDERITVRLGAAPQTFVWPEPLGDARAIDVQINDEFEQVVWSDGLTLRALDSALATFVVPDCEEGAVPRRLVAAAGEVVATQHELLRVNPQCEDGQPCLEPFFGLADYHRAMFDEFTDAELASCDGCALALEDGCWGTEQCREDFDSSTCVGCEVGGCPTLEVVGVTELADGYAVTTGRGVIALDGTGAVVARAESAFDPNVAGGPRFVGAHAAPGAVTLLHSTGFVRVLDDALQPLAADLGVPYDLETASIGGVGSVFVAVSGETVRLTQPTARSGRSAFLTLETAPGVQGLRPVLAVARFDDVVVFYAAAGQVYERRVFKFRPD